VQEKLNFLFFVCYFVVLSPVYWPSLDLAFDWVWVVLDFQQDTIRQSLLARSHIVSTISLSLSRVDEGLFGSKESSMLVLIYHKGLLNVNRSMLAVGSFANLYTLVGACSHSLAWECSAGINYVNFICLDLNVCIARLGWHALY
jgi:hypothetical protein